MKIKKGKILRVKHGYNPNSSSLGSVVFALPVGLLAVTAGFGVVSAIIVSCFIKKENEEKKPEKSNKQDFTSDHKEEEK